MTDTLHISIAFTETPTPVGRMIWDVANRQAVVEWAPEFLARPLPLSPYAIRQYAGLSRTRSPAFEGLAGVFGDSVPDGWGRLLIDRELAALGQPHPTPVDRLAMVGAHGMGALTYRPEAEAQMHAQPDLDWLAGVARSEALTLDELARARVGAGGSAGARPKLVALLTAEGTLRDHRAKPHPDERAVLIKHPGPTDPTTMAEEEHAYALMAWAAGIDMGRTQVLHAASGQSFFCADRFDRTLTGRLHMHTAAGLLEADFRQPVADYETVLKLTRFVVKDIRAVREMVRRMIFNVMAHNRDDHLKNHAFLMDAQGQWRLSPAYDLSLSDGPGGEHHLAIAGEGRNPTRDHLRKVATEAGLKPRDTEAIFDEVRNAIEDWPTFADQAKVPKARVKTISAKLAHVLAG